MKYNKEISISFLAANATTIVSVTLVLVLIGLIAMISAAASGETRRLREQVEISAILGDSVGDRDAHRVLEDIKALPEVNDTRLITSAEAMRNWKEETGEDLEALFGVNIFSPEIVFTLKAEFTEPAMLARVEKKVKAFPGVAEVASPDTEMMSTMNENISTLSVILGIIAIVMTIISFVLINNTVHLSIYSRRFTIHTMELVGATNGFIRGPFVRNNLFAGLIAGVLASVLLAVGLFAARNTFEFSPAEFISPMVYAIIAVGLLLIGTLICSLAAWMATARYLRKDYGQLFR